MNIQVNKNFANKLYFVCTQGEKFKNLPPHIKMAFSAKLLSCHNYYDTNANEYVTLVGVGDFDKVTNRDIMEAAAVGIKAAKSLGIDTLSVISLKDANFISYIVQGLILGQYKFSDYKTNKDETTKDIDISIDSQDGSDITSAVYKAVNLANAVAFARDLFTIPSNIMYPETLAQLVKETLTPLGLCVEVFDENQIEDMKMGSYLAVANGSARKPRLIVIRHMNGGDSEITALIGKGLTMDTGGYSLKPSAGMQTMNGDMAGAGAVIGTMMALAQNDIKSNVVAVIAACENRIGDNARVPGDVVTSMSGKTIEILNTDAEGRLTLVDAVTYAKEKENASRIVDIATLTGAVVAALGHSTAGTVTNNDEFYKEFTTASEVACEQHWLLPSYNEYKKYLDSDIADLKNIGKPFAGSITAGLFIGEFAGDTPWIHVDIAGTSRVDAPIFAYQSTGATGCGVTTLYHLFDK